VITTNEDGIAEIKGFKGTYKISPEDDGVTLGQGQETVEL
jgi:hypothetical protein